MLAEQNAMFPDPNQINSDKLIQIKTVKSISYPKLNAVYVCNEKNGSKKKRDNPNRNAVIQFFLVKKVTAKIMM